MEVPSRVQRQSSSGAGKAKRKCKWTLQEHEKNTKQILVYYMQAVHSMAKFNYDGGWGGMHLCPPLATPLRMRNVMSLKHKEKRLRMSLLLLKYRRKNKNGAVICKETVQIIVHSMSFFHRINN